jgi:hypothetical protein
VGVLAGFLLSMGVGASSRGALLGRFQGLEQSARSSCLDSRLGDPEP